MLTLERMGSRNPAVYAAAARQAVRFSASTRTADSSRSASFKARSPFLRGWWTSTRSKRDPLNLGRLLCAVPLNGNGSYAGGIARWLEHSLAPAVGISVDAFDAGLIASLAGCDRASPPRERSCPGSKLRTRSTSRQLRCGA